MHAAAPKGDSVPPAHAGAAPIYLAGDRPSERLRSIVRERDAYTDAQVEALESALLDLYERVGARLAAALGGEPAGDTPIEALLAGLTETQAIEAAILSTTLRDIATLLDDAGLGDIRDQWFRGYGRLAEFSEDALDAAGVPVGSRILDDEAVRATIGRMMDAQDEALFGGVDASDEGVTGAAVRPTAQRMVDALRANATLMSPQELAAQIVETESLRVDHAATEARTRMAEFDRYVQEEGVRLADPDDNLLLRVYVGPDDRITRPFCDVLVGKAFTVADFRRANNGQIGHPLTHGGGYNCRHHLIPVMRSDVAEFGYTVGGPDDIAAANAAAQNARSGKRKRKRGRR